MGFLYMSWPRLSGMRVNLRGLTSASLRLGFPRVALQRKSAWTRREETCEELHGSILYITRMWRDTSPFSADLTKMAVARLIVQSSRSFCVHAPRRIDPLGYRKL